MSRTTLRIVIILAALSITGIIITQVYWVRRAFDIRENQFNHDVNASLNNVAQKIFEINKTPSAANNAVQQVSTNYFIALINGPIDAGLLEFLLVTEFEKHNITADFEYGIYDCWDKCMVGGNYVSPGKVKVTSNFPQTPLLNNDGYYFAVIFPRVEANIIGQMGGIWGFSTAVMLIVIFFFVYTLLVILRQRRLSEIQKDFINNMTHEFKTPLSTIAISSEVIRDSSIIQNPGRLMNYAGIIQNEVLRLKQQVERVLQMAKLDEGDLEMKTELLDVHELIREAAVSNSVMLEAASATLQMDLSASHTSVKADRLHLSNVIFNLLDNAVKYNRQKPEIRIITRNVNHHLSISVSDNGIGIEKKHLGKIFHKFFRVPTGNVHDVKGFGLGLNYVKMIIEKQGGKISLQSEPGKGSTFTLTIPIA